MIDLTRLKESLHGKPVAIMGLGKSGMPVYEACKKAGVETVLWDDNPDQRRAAEEMGATVRNLSTVDMKGFAILCLSPGIQLEHPVAKKAREAGVEVTGDIELFHRARPDAKTIGITGTNGKSTTTALIGHILKEAKVPSAVGGNIGEAALTLPNLGDGATYVLELSSYQLDLLREFRPDISVLINLSPDHLERHGTMDNYVAAKERIFDDKGVAIIGVDDDWSEEVHDRLKKAGKRKLIPMSCQRPLRGGIFASADGMLFDGDRKIIDLNTCPALKGQHNWQNAAAAYAACREAGVDPDVIAEALQSFPGLAHRQNIITALNGVTYINDSKATNDQAAAMALRTYNQIYWIAGGKSKNGGYADCDKYLDRVRHAFLIGEAEEEIARWLDSRKIPYIRCGTLAMATVAAHRMAQSEKRHKAAVLLSPACASLDQFRSFEHRGEAFVDLVTRLTQGEPKNGPAPGKGKKGKPR